jgi:hypothetical protein
MNIRTRVATTVFAALMLGAPAFAQSQIDNNQPVQGDLHAREASLQTRLTAAFNGGLIDSNELASMQRDLDGILTRETDFRNRSSGLTSGGYDTIQKSLDLFEARLSRHSDKTDVVNTSSGAVVGVPLSQTTTPVVPVAPVTVITPAPTATVTETTVGPSDVTETTVRETTVETTDMAR